MGTMDNIMSDFISESSGLLDDAEESILSIEEGKDPEAIHRVFRALHTIKGNSGLFDLPQITKLSHAMETMLNRLRNSNETVHTDTIDLLLTGIDQLRQMIHNMDQSFEIDDLADQFLKAVSETSAAADSSTAAEKITAAGQTEKSTPSDLATSNAKPSGPENGLPLVNGKKIPKGQPVKIPARYVKQAKEDGSSLFLVFLDLYNYGKTLTEACQNLKSALNHDSVIKFGPASDRITSNSPFYYYLIVFGETDISSFLSSYNITPLQIKPVLRKDPATEAKKDYPLSAEKSQQTSENAEDSPAPARPSDREIELKSLQGETESPNATAPSVSGNSEIITETGANDPDDQSSTAAAGIQETSITTDTHLKVPVKLIDSLINLAGETVIARNAIMQRIADSTDNTLNASGKRISYLITKLQEGIMQIRLQELNSVFLRIPRLVRDVAHKTGKEVRLVTEGGEVELDKTLIDAIIDPLAHMIRNSIDHGIETPDDRLAAGKPAEGILKIRATLRGGNVLLNISDDGRGLNYQKIKTIAQSKGLMSRQDLERATQEQLADLIFLPGFSTVDKVTTTSGRGVGMDVVRTNLKRIGGSIFLDSQPGKGMTATINLPQTLTIITCLMIQSAGKRFALPQTNVKELLRIDSSLISTVENRQVYNLRGHLIPLLHLGGLMKMDANSAAGYIAIVSSERHFFGLMIDEILNPEEIVVRPLGEHFAGIDLFSGAAVMGDGEAVLILDIPGIARFSNLPALAQEEISITEKVAEEMIHGYLIVEVLDQFFAIPVETTPRIEKISPEDLQQFIGHEVIQYREEVVPLIRIEEYYQLNARGSTRNLETSYVIIFQENGMKTGIVVSEVHNVLDTLPQIHQGKFADESVQGHVILNGKTTIVLDMRDLITRVQENRFKKIKHAILTDNIDMGEQENEIPLSEKPESPPAKRIETTV